MRVSIFGLTLLSILLLLQKAIADPINFSTEQYSCQLSVDGVDRGKIEPGTPLTINLFGGGGPFSGSSREYLVECESHEIPVKLYARHYLYRRLQDVTVVPVAVLPNAIRAAAAGKIDVTAIADSSSLACEITKEDPKDSFFDKSRQIKPEHPYRIPKGASVQLTGASLLHCGDTNLIEVVVQNSKSWFRNQDFVFSYKGKTIALYRPSQIYECCWIE